MCPAYPNHKLYKRLSIRPSASLNWWSRFKDPQLNKLISVALNDSPDMLIAQTRIRQAQHIAEETASSLWPTLDMSGYLQRQRFSKLGLVPPPFNGKTFNIAVLALNFNYELDFWGKNRQTLMAKLSQKRAVEAELVQARLVISAAVADTYFQLCNNIAQVKMARTNWRLNRQILQIATMRAKQGINSDIPVKTIQANMGKQQNYPLNNTGKQELVSRHQLAILLGKNPFATTIETRRFTFPIAITYKLPAFFARQAATLQRPDIYAAKLRTQAAASLYQCVKSTVFP